MRERNLDAEGPELYSLLQKSMLSVFFGLVAHCAIAVGLAFIFGVAMPLMPNKACRFIFLFVLGVPLHFVINYVNVLLLGYHKMGWRAAIIIGLLVATYGTFLLPQARGSHSSQHRA